MALPKIPAFVSTRCKDFLAAVELHGGDSPEAHDALDALMDMRDLLDIDGDGVVTSEELDAASDGETS